MNTKVKHIISAALLVVTVVSAVFFGAPGIAAAKTAPGSGSTTSESAPVLTSYTGSIDTAETSEPALSVGEVFVDLDSSSILVGKGYPVLVSAVLNGNLPDPCHKLVVEVNPANGASQINLSVYSVYDAQQSCINVLQPFSTTFELGTFTRGTYSVYVNGKLLDTFTIKSPIFITAR